ncbi:MAG: hypothetical protein JETT_1694 [Candidatus Jettenia ecosi]|uniref:Uncharacterized protein n=1 Tax=Candidatus Jettenia ecosi TaxID=2494326 RepID=A0A533QBK8_9BACT|nr:MAG: hypothetical protein JETT_1694 [Candidatus Jettenia ecosi]
MIVEFIQKSHWIPNFLHRNLNSVGQSFMIAILVHIFRRGRQG